MATPLSIGLCCRDSAGIYVRIIEASWFESAVGRKRPRILFRKRSWPYTRDATLTIRPQLLTPWVYAIARYKLIDHLRQSQSTLTNVPIEDASEIIAADGEPATESNLDLN